MFANLEFDPLKRPYHESYLKNKDQSKAWLLTRR